MDNRTEYWFNRSPVSLQNQVGTINLTRISDANCGMRPAELGTWKPLLLPTLEFGDKTKVVYQNQ